MIGFICFGCSGMSQEQRKESYDLRSSVGNQPFVGSPTNNIDARGMMTTIGL